MMAHWCEKYNAEVWAWCLMLNHVHLIAVSHNKEGLGQFLRLPPQEEVDTQHRHEKTGRHLGKGGFVENQEKS